MCETTKVVEDKLPLQRGLHLPLHGVEATSVFNAPELLRFGSVRPLGDVVDLRMARTSASAVDPMLDVHMVKDDPTSVAMVRQVPLHLPTVTGEKRCATALALAVSITNRPGRIVRPLVQGLTY
jgi:hypothetical protein